MVEPCCGISGYRELSTVGNFPYSTAAYDNDKRLGPFWEARRIESADWRDVILKTGCTGDVYAVTMDALLALRSEGVNAGPPCQPFNSAGLRLWHHEPVHVFA